MQGITVFDSLEQAARLGFYKCGEDSRTFLVRKEVNKRFVMAVVNK